MQQYENPSPSKELESRIVQTGEKIKSIEENIEKVIKGKNEVVQKLLISIIADGHVLLYDVPGVGKTVLARTLAKSISAVFKRIQFTPDLLPSDVIGVNVYDPADKKFEFQQGPIFTNILLADEINRTSPKTQSSLLEAMEERQVSVDNETHMLPGFFFVIATQNPVEHDGTYPLPAAQLDRFLLRLDMGYPTMEIEQMLVQQFSGHHPLEDIQAVTDELEVLSWQKLAKEVFLSPKAAEYIVNLSRKTRELSSVNIGVSPRGSINLAKVSKATALMRGRSYVTPDDIQFVTENVFAHRLSEASGVGASVVKEVLNSVAVD
jgi:MoxR-like ATPase